MLEAHFLIDADFDEENFLETSELASRYNSSFLNLTIGLTMNCNMACPYCYEHKNTTRMNDAVKNAIVKYVQNKSHEIRKLNIVWYGGEPLLEIDTLKYLAREFIQICEKEKIEYSSHIITNGYLLTADLAKTLFEEYQVKYAQITIDGTKETHNQRRRLKNGGDSFSVIIKNIDEISKSVPDFKISIRVNIDKTNSDGIKELFNYFMDEKGWGQGPVTFYAACVSDYENPSCETYYNFEEFGEIYLDLFHETKKRFGFEWTLNEIPSFTPTACGALRENNYVIDPDGDFYKCFEEIGIKDKRIASLFEVTNNFKRQFQWSTLSLPQECRKCIYRPCCQGYCPYARIDDNKPHCTFRKVLYPAFLKEYFEDTKLLTHA